MKFLGVLYILYEYRTLDKARINTYIIMLHEESMGKAMLFLGSLSYTPT